MSLKDGLPCKKCGTQEWYVSGACKECKRRYYLDNREKILKRNAEYAVANRDVRKAIKQRRRARKQKAPGSFTADEWYNLCSLYDFHCLSCMIQFPYRELTVDHVVPLSKGGSNWVTNLQPLCSACNSVKHAKHIDYRTNWAISKERLYAYTEEGREGTEGEIPVQT